LYEQLKSKNFVVIAVAFDTGGEAAVREWIEAAEPSYPCLIDEKHIVAELYDMVNVPTGVWINEDGEIVRPGEPAGWSDAWRTGDQKELKRSKDRYLDAVRNWVEHGIHSSFLVEPDEVRKRMPGPTDEHALATAYYRMGLFLTGLGYKNDARKHFSKSMNLRKESWNFKRQTWTLIETQEVRRDKFKEAIEVLGEQRYYPKLELENKKR
jgi:hypothetical protein